MPVRAIWKGDVGNKKAPQKRGLVLLVGRARFELATNGLKEKIH